ncbi:MAG: AAA family ATPase [Bacilli bacterium]|nr:AAA family ATPase [Bacilli bacterium]
MNQPLSYKMRPDNLNNFFGQKHLFKENSLINKIIKEKKIVSLILFGPPGIGKTSLATIICKNLDIQYRFLNATTCTRKDMEEILLDANMYGEIVLILDEVHRLNKDKQDFFLPHIESGLITLIGMTTANPYHYINPAIRSRCNLIELYQLTTSDVVDALNYAISSPKGLNNEYIVEEDAIKIIAELSGGDIRFALNQLEVAAISCTEKNIRISDVKTNTKVPQYLIDNNEDGHYDAVSALQKSIRGSDVNASLYYLARLIAANDLSSIERRLSVTAYEDIGLANPAAVDRTIKAIETAKMLGFPEGAIPLGFAVVDLALSPKSKSSCNAIQAAIKNVEENIFSMPKYLKLTPHNIKSEAKYPYDRPDLWDKIQYLPDEIKKIEFFKGSLNSKYERALVENYTKLKSCERSNDIPLLKKKYNKKG